MPSPTAPPTSSPLEQDQPNTAYAHITELSGDLLSMAEIGSFDLIAHGCNCFHTMGAGIALALARRFPEIRTADRRTIYGDRKKLGTYSTARVYAGQSAKLLTILNCYTQYHYGFQATHTPNCSYPAIEKVMIAINRNFTGQHLGIPRIGSGLAKGKWPLIREIIGQSTPDIKVTIVHYSK
jgi:O-acetyl-ADP-ribose deacetylase (regulator of RNase III)